MKGSALDELSAGFLGGSIAWRKVHSGSDQAPSIMNRMFLAGSSTLLLVWQLTLFSNAARSHRR
jgi:hypothetical protein